MPTRKRKEVASPATRTRSRTAGSAPRFLRPARLPGMNNSVGRMSGSKQFRRPITTPSSRACASSDVGEWEMMGNNLKSPFSGWSAPLPSPNSHQSALRTPGFGLIFDEKLTAH